MVPVTTGMAGQELPHLERAGGSRLPCGAALHLQRRQRVQEQPHLPAHAALPPGRAHDYGVRLPHHLTWHCSTAQQRTVASGPCMLQAVSAFTILARSLPVIMVADACNRSTSHCYCVSTSCVTTGASSTPSSYREWSSPLTGSCTLYTVTSAPGTCAHMHWEVS